jgi:hypothetical protein
MFLCKDLLKRQNAYTHSLQSQEYFMYGCNKHRNRKQINKEKCKKELKQQTATNKQTNKRLVSGFKF